MATVAFPRFTISPHSAGFNARVKILDEREIIFERVKERGQGTFLDLTSFNGEIHKDMKEMCGGKLRVDLIPKN